MIIMDFSKAFDKVPHRRLQYKLNWYGIRGITHTWIQNVLQGRSQRVVSEGRNPPPIMSSLVCPKAGENGVVVTSASCGLQRTPLMQMFPHVGSMFSITFKHFKYTIT